MKKILSFLLAITATMAIHAEVIWTGEHSTGSSWNALRLIPAEYTALADISEGDVLAVTMTADAADARVMLQDGDWKDFTDTYNVYDAKSGVHAFVLNAADAAQIAEKGVCVTGQLYTISKVEIFYHKSQVWSGNISDNTGWTQSSAIDNSAFAGLQAGDLLGVEISAINDGATWHQYSVYINWRSELFKNPISATGTYVRALSADEVDSLQNQIVVVAAQYLDIKALHTYEATKSAQPAGETQSIWSGSVVMPGNWGAWQTIEASKFATAETGQLLRCRFTAVGSNAQLQLKETTKWEELVDAPLALISGRYYDYTITADMLAELKARGVIVSGCNYTLTEVLLINPADLKPLTLAVPVTDNWVFTAKPSITVHVENPYDEAVTANIEVEITTDKAIALDTILASREIAAGTSQDIVLTTENNLAAGFYKATCIVNDDLARAFGFAVNPTDIVSAPDQQTDFASYWTAAKQQLDAIAINATLTEIPAKSTANRKVYLVEMQSVPDGLTGEPVIIRGYYAEPQDGQQHPVIMHYQGYDSGYRPGGEGNTPYCMHGDAEPDYAEFILSNRGQSVNNRPAADREDGINRDFTNTYGDWFAFNFGDKDSYYYRGAYMDCVRAIQFMASRPTSDMNNLYAEGQSQGGAFTYAAASLSGYTFRAIAPAIAFMGDFPDYFDITNWPAYVARENQGTMTDEQMFAFLSYFDTKNLAATISCPVIACIGLQDNVCPPHTNIAPYNNLLSTDKELIFNPENAHQAGSTWYADYMAFFKAREQSTTTAIEAVSGQPLAVSKFFRDGQLIIVRDGQAYTILGQLK